MRGTRTYAIVEVSSPTFREIADILRESGYDHAFRENGQGRLTIDLQGLAMRERVIYSSSEPTDSTPAGRKEIP